MTTAQLHRPHRPGPAGRLFLGPDRRLRRWWRVLAHLTAVLARRRVLAVVAYLRS
ncbi:hypothetical protein K7640_11280 [Micromonospora sp. PLK6-60]|uniref:hypothetical protein n=1 Tax=Micromonospora sp. PLK6-60 TaxID=2873383 RepID=UPI001CA76C45|nr:hypothetical protein [Micromonospora sp. PLK6-60]MBY8872422.1 hypothetical protein [Micromonospora sp. PLK6-60]